MKCIASKCFEQKKKRKLIYLHLIRLLQVKQNCTQKEVCGLYRLLNAVILDQTG